MLIWRCVMDLGRSGEERRWELYVWRGKKKDERERGRAHAHEVKLMRQGIRWVPSGWVKLQKCHITQFSITWKYSKCVFSFHNSSLKNQRIEWLKQKLKNKSKHALLPWDPLVLSYGWWKTWNPNNPLFSQTFIVHNILCLLANKYNTRWVHFINNTKEVLYSQTFILHSILCLFFFFWFSC